LRQIVICSAQAGRGAGANRSRLALSGLGGLAKAVQSGEKKYRYGGTDERVNEKVKAEIGRRLVEEGTFREGEDALVEMKKGERQDEACNRMIRIDVRAYC